MLQTTLLGYSLASVKNVESRSKYLLHYFLGKRVERITRECPKIRVKS